jgi:hypothetical protein
VNTARVAQGGGNTWMLVGSLSPLRLANLLGEAEPRATSESGV